MERKECRMVGEWRQRQTFFLLHVLVNLTGKTPTYLHRRALSADSSPQLFLVFEAALPSHDTHPLFAFCLF